VVGAITPWNFPILLGPRKTAPCLITEAKMMASVSSDLKRSILELDGNDPAIVLPGRSYKPLRTGRSTRS